jgi:hypothetical protein
MKFLSLRFYSKLSVTESNSCIRLNNIHYKEAGIIAGFLDVLSPLYSENNTPLWKMNRFPSSGEKVENSYYRENLLGKRTLFVWC